jgi:hypothetical protein
MLSHDCSPFAIGLDIKNHRIAEELKRIPLAVSTLMDGIYPSFV